MNKNPQRELIETAEKTLMLGPIGLADRLQTPYPTLKDWKSGRSRMPGVARLAIELLIEQHNENQ